MLRVVIPEPIPSANKGELAILEGIRETLNHCGTYELAVYSPPSQINDDMRRSDGNYHVVGGINLFGRGNVMPEHSGWRTRIHFLRTWGTLWLFSLIHRLSGRLAMWRLKDPLLKAIGNADLILAAHDGTLNQSHSYLALAARIMKKPLAVYGASHNMEGRLGLKVRKCFQYLIKHAILCTVRDPRAKEFFVANGIAPDRVHVFPDPAVLLEPCGDARAREILAAENIPQPEDSPLYGLIPTRPVKGGRLLRESFASEKGPENRYKRYLQLWAEIVDHLLSTTNAHCVFIPHCIGPGERNDDRRMSQAIYQVISGAKSRVTLLEGDYTPSELKGIMKHCDYVLGQRAHALIGAVSVGTPCMAMATKGDLRMFHIMERMFDRIVFDLSDPNVAELKELLTAEWNGRAQTAVTMGRKAAEIRAEAIRASELLSGRIREATNLRNGGR